MALNITKLNITLEGVNKLLNIVHISLSKGPDGIPNTILKNWTEALAHCLIVIKHLVSLIIKTTRRLIKC